MWTEYLGVMEAGRRLFPGPGLQIRLAVSIQVWDVQDCVEAFYPLHHRGWSGGVKISLEGREGVMEIIVVAT